MWGSESLGMTLYGISGLFKARSSATAGSHLYIATSSSIRVVIKNFREVIDFISHIQGLATLDGPNGPEIIVNLTDISRHFQRLH